MTKLNYWISLAIIALIFFSSMVVAQPKLKLSGDEKDRGLQQLSSGFLTVVKEARIDLDSSLVLTSRRHNLSRVPVITEDLDDSYPLQNCKWMDQGNLAGVKKQLTSLRGKESTRLLMLIGAYYAFQPGLQTTATTEAISYLRRAQKSARHLKLTRWDAQCTILLGKCYMKDGNIEAGKAAFSQVTSNPSWAADDRLNAKAWNYLGMYCPFIPETVLLRINSLEKAAALFHKLNDLPNESNALTNTGYLYFAMGKMKESENAVKRAYDLQLSSGFPYSHYTADMLACLAHMNGNYASELAYAMRSLKTAEDANDRLGLAYFYARVADSYVQDDRHITESNFWFHKSLNEFIKYGGDPALYRILTCTTFVESGLGGSRPLLALLQQLKRDFPPGNTNDEQFYYLALGNCYEGLHEPVEAEKYFLKAEQLEPSTHKIRSTVNIGYVYNRLGSFYLHSRNYKKSKAYLNKYLSVFSKTRPDSSMLSKTYWMLAVVDSATGNYPAMRNLYQYAIIRDRVYTISRNREVEELNIRYQTLQKQKDAAMYKARTALELQKAATDRRIGFIALLILVIVIVFILLRYYSKQKSERLLQRQKDEIDKKNQLLQSVIREKDDLLVSKEWLLKEVHHRVKNNLQLIMSLLNSQTTYLHDELALNAVMESRHRVQAMSLIHQKLYKTDEVSNVDMREYIKSLVEYLKESFKTKLSIYFELQLSTVSLDVSQAIPVGLILNEVITNAIKHAFPHGSGDRISISFAETMPGSLSLIVSDNGSGLPADFDGLSSASFGMILINGLTADLEGAFTISSAGETTVAQLTFAYHDALERK